MTQRSAFLADHFQTPEQQFAAGKLGMWIFLLTEILLFGGLFCAYAVYRANHPEIFVYAHQFLDKNLGAINTAVLILSSLTMAWGVRCAQRDRQRGLVVCLLVTLALRLRVSGHQVRRVQGEVGGRTALGPRVQAHRAGGRGPAPARPRARPARRPS